MKLRVCMCVVLCVYVCVTWSYSSPGSKQPNLQPSIPRRVNGSSPYTKKCTVRDLRLSQQCCWRFVSSQMLSHTVFINRHGVTSPKILISKNVNTSTKQVAKLCLNNTSDTLRWYRGFSTISLFAWGRLTKEREIPVAWRERFEFGMSFRCVLYSRPVCHSYQRLYTGLGDQQHFLQ
jgi:hypothetical protein